MKKWLNELLCRHDWKYTSEPSYNVKCIKCGKRDVFNTHG